MPNGFARLFRPAPFSDSLKIYLSANAILRAAGIGRGILLTWLMVNQTEFGLYQEGLLLINVLFPLLSWGSYEGIARFVPEFEARRQLWAFLKKTLPLWALLGALSCAAVWAFAEPLVRLSAKASTDPVRQIRVLRLVVVCVMSLMMYHGALAVLRGRRMFPAIGMMEMATGVVFSILAIGAALVGHGTADVILGIYAVANAAGAGLFGAQALWVARQAPQQPSLPASAEFRKQARFAVWAGGSAFFWQVLFCFPALQLSRVCGEDVLATFRAMTIITQLGYLIPAAISMVVVSAVTVTWERSGRAASTAQLNVATKATMAAALVGCLGICALRGVLVLAFREQYRAGGSVVPLLLIFYLAAGALTLCTVRFTLLKESRLTFVCWSAGCVAAVFSSLLFIRRQDPAGALVMTAVAGVCGVTVALLLALLHLQRRRLLPDRGTLLLIAGVVLLIAEVPVLIAAAVAIVLLSVSTEWIFTHQERHQLHDLGRRLLSGSQPAT